MQMRQLLIASFIVLLAACGGGGGGEVPAPNTTLAANATVTYGADNAPAFSYDPWTNVKLTPTVTGVPASTALTFLGGMPVGLALHPGNGIITGFPFDDYGYLGSRQTLDVNVTAAGYTGSIDVSYLLYLDGLSFFGSATGGFAVTGGHQITGTAGVVGTIEMQIGLDKQEADGVHLNQPIPAGTTVVYSFGTGSFVGAGAMVGATIDPATGVVTWTPPAAGDYGFELQVVTTRNGRQRTTRDQWAIHVN